MSHGSFRVFQGTGQQNEEQRHGSVVYSAHRGFQSLLAASTDQRREEQEGGRGGKKNRVERGAEKEMRRRVKGGR